MEWLKEGIEHLIQIGRGEPPFLIDDNGLSRLRSTGALLPPPLPDVLHVGSIESLTRAAIARRGPDASPSGVAVVVESATRVVLRDLTADKYGRSAVGVVAEVKPTHIFTYDRYLDAEEFLVRLQTGFLPDADCDLPRGDLHAVMELASTLQPEKVTTLTDDGVTQVATVRRTAGRLSSAALKNPVQLYPLGLTFADIAPPRWRLILRLKQDKDGEMPKLALFSAGDLGWEHAIKGKIAAMIRSLLGPDCIVFT